ncbi:MAG: hypothetical protein WCO57_10965, partial [Verrucomicrobiota bacterium]
MSHTPGSAGVPPAGFGILPNPLATMCRAARLMAMAMGLLCAASAAESANTVSLAGGQASRLSGPT